MVLEIGDEITQRRLPQTDDRRVASDIDRLVDLPRLEARRQTDEPQIGHWLAIVTSCETPAVVGDHPPLPEPRITNGQDIARIGRVAHRVGEVTTVSEGQGDLPLGENLVGTYQSLDGALDGGGADRIEPQQLGVRGHVVLPADPHQRESAPHEEAVAEIGGGHRVTAPGGTPIEIAHHRLATPVGDLHQNSAVAPPGIYGSQDVEIGRILHPAILPPGCLVEIDHPGVARVVRVERKDDPTLQLLVGTGETEGMAIGQELSHLDFDALDLPDRDRGKQKTDRDDDDRGGRGGD